jgi:hypothetical protein
MQASADKPSMGIQYSGACGKEIATGMLQDLFSPKASREIQSSGDTYDALAQMNNTNWKLFLDVPRGDLATVEGFNNQSIVIRQGDIPIYNVKNMRMVLRQAIRNQSTLIEFKVSDKA